MHLFQYNTSKTSFTRYTSLFAPVSRKITVYFPPSHIPFRNLSSSATRIFHAPRNTYTQTARTRDAAVLFSLSLPLFNTYLSFSLAACRSLRRTVFPVSSSSTSPPERAATFTCSTRACRSARGESAFVQGCMYVYTYIRVV